MRSATIALTVAAFQAGPSTSALIGPDGTILTVNEAWRRFGDENGAGSRCGPGANYLAVTDRAARGGDEVAATVADALVAVLSGNASSARVDYPCHSPGRERWFRLHAQPLPGRREVLLVHDDITELVELRLRQKALAEPSPPAPDPGPAPATGPPGRTLRPT